MQNAKKKQTFAQASLKAAVALWKSFPLIFGTILLVSLLPALIPQSFYASVFGDNTVLNAFVGSAIGSISAGNPVVSYIVGGELLKQGVSLIAVTAFLTAWVTVGLIQLPAESALLGKRFALTRNITAFFLAIIVGIATVLLLQIL